MAATWGGADWQEMAAGMTAGRRMEHFSNLCKCSLNCVSAGVKVLGQTGDQVDGTQHERRSAERRNVLSAVSAEKTISSAIITVIVT